MTKHFTQNDVLRYIYNERLNTQEKQDIENSLLTDDSLSEFYFETLSLQKMLTKAEKQPSDRVVNNILEYSRSFSLCH